MAEAKVGGAELIPISEHSRVLMAMHKAMRADSQRLIAAAAALPDGDTGAAAALGRAFAAIVGLVHDHHWTEDDVMYPFLLDRVRTFEHDAIRLENDHVELDAAMARINARFRLLAHQLSAAPGRTREATSWTRRQPSTACWSTTSTARRTWSSPHSNR
jgi:Hemerythrin HHE cation binding domain